jgi:LmbE family N-acetylglucosaminyl deacetylase
MREIVYKEYLQKITLLISLFSLVNLLSISIYSFFQEKPKKIELLKPQNILVFAAHQDDCVIQAGGAAIKNSKMGGKTTIVYLTVPSDIKYALIRKREAQASWNVLNDKNINLIFLEFISDRVWSEDKKVAAEKKIIAIIEKTKPDVVYIPLNEGGHQEHDVLNSMILNVINRFPSIKVIQSAEYNPYYIMKNTPTKVLWFLVKLLPFVPYKQYEYGLNPTNQIKLLMSQDELQMKINMLLKFESQRDVIPVNQFGYEDLYESTRHRPKYFIKIMGKYLSFWSFLTLISIFLMLFLWGSISANYLNFKKPIIFIILTLIWSIIFVVFIRNPMLLIEDFLYLISYLSGLSSTALVSKIKTEAGMSVDL